MIKKIILFFYGKLIIPIVTEVNNRISSSIPSKNLLDVHIKNAKLILNRNALLSLLPVNGVVAEIGVNEGVFSSEILSINKPEKLHLIDIWGSSKTDITKRNLVEKKFSKLISEKKVEINVGFSTDVFNLFDDNYFDWIYIDTDHTYKTTKKELLKYMTKIKPGGFIVGHDYVRTNWSGITRYGVVEAVNEFCLEYNWELIYLTVEINNPSFAIRKF